MPNTTERMMGLHNSERIFGSERFRSLTRKPDLESPKRFEPTVKADGDVVIGAETRWRSFGPEPLRVSATGAHRG